MRKDDEAPAPADGEEPKPPTKLKITFNGTPEQLEELMAMLEKLRLPDDEAPPSETPKFYAPARFPAAGRVRACAAAIINRKQGTSEMNAETKNYVPIEREDERRPVEDPMLAALAEYANEVCGAVSGARAKYVKRDWTLDDELIAADERFWLFPLTIVRRQEYWKDKKLVETRTAPLGGKLPPLVQPPEETWEKGQDGRPKPPWSEVDYIGGIRERDGLRIFFAASSKGGRQAIGNLAKAVVQTSAGRAGMVPIVTFSEDFYTHREYGKTYIPVFEIVGWAESPDSAPRIRNSGKPLLIGSANEPPDADEDGGRWAPISAYE